MRFDTGGKARLTVSLPERSLRITVEDDGPGIPAARREEAMQPFARLDAARNQNHGSGVGLGLAIARDIAQRQGGTLTPGRQRGPGWFARRPRVATLGWPDRLSARGRGLPRAGGQGAVA